MNEKLFVHPYFELYDFDQLPENRDCYLMDEVYAKAYEKTMLDVFARIDAKPWEVGYVSYVAVRLNGTESATISWYPNIGNRLHEVITQLPRSVFFRCVECWQYNEKPRIFVEGNWLRQLNCRENSVFCMIDAIGTKNAIKSNKLTRTTLVRLREEIDLLSNSNPDISFISFADTVILKSSWVGKDINSYQPEKIIKIIYQIKDIYWKLLDLRVYAVLTQGSNAYYQDTSLHISKTQNHVCLNSLGFPFAQLKEIEEDARTHIRNKRNSGFDIYIDETFLKSLNFKSDVRASTFSTYYHSKTTGTSPRYYCFNYETLLKELNTD